MLKRVSTAGMSREDWLAARRHTIGGSDAAGIIGLSRYSTPFTVWADKTGRAPDKLDTEAMRQGRDLEEYVAKRWCEVTGKKVRRCRAMLYNDLYPHSHADVDRLVIGESAGLECKTTSTLDVREFKGVEFPARYYAQSVHYLAVTGLARWYLAVLVFGRGLYVYTLERDEAEIAALMQAEADFWERYVAKDTPPAPDGSEATEETIGTIWRESRDEVRTIFGRESLLDEYGRLKEQKRAVEDRIREIESTVKTDMGEAAQGTCGSWRITWRTHERKSLMAPKLAAEHPEIDLASYYKTATVRPFTIKKIEEETA